MLGLYEDRYKDAWIVMADTGDEKLETYYYIQQYLLPWFEKRNMKFMIVKNSKWRSLYDKCIIKHLIPSRNKRWCTDEFKRTPVRNFVRKLGATKRNPFTQDLGISFDEFTRMNTTNDTKYLKSLHPLIDDKITRDDCKKFIENEMKLPVPPKSGCFYCPYVRLEEMRQLKIRHPEQFEKMLILEKNGSRYPEMFLRNKPLDQYNFNNYLDDYMEESSGCMSGYCHS